ncbi:MAG: calcium-binding protein [Rhodobacteraceae bacterium]|nr:calcium-binding protein [Paracoccaceae bacterium]
MHMQFAFAAALATVLLADTAAAQGFGRSPKPVPFEEMDANGDGEVTQAEMQAHGRARFEATDTDKDGYLSTAELQAKAEGPARLFVGRIMARVDADGDGRLSLDEMRAAAPNRDTAFQDMDTDNSGGLNRAEMEAGKDKARQMAPAQLADQG